MCNAAVKQEASKENAYGKVKVFKETKLQQLMHVDEVLAGLQLALFHRPQPLTASKYVRENFDTELVEFIDQMVMSNDVVHVSSLLLRMLPGPVLVDAQVMSQTLRALDCIEDEPTYYGDDLEAKIKDMLTFHEKALVDPNWSFPGIGESPPERQLMKEFPKIHKLFKSLRPESQKAVVDVTVIMAKGMADFLRMDLSQGPKTLQQYEDYCYAISGSVGEALSQVWAAAGIEDPSLAKNTYLSRRMGNFAIKPTMIFTFMEDVVDKRVKWPQEIWKQYSSTGKLDYFFDQGDPVVRAKSIQCLNAVVTDALAMVPDSLKYLEQLQCYENFTWVAIIIVATMAQLDMCYANEKIFLGNVIMRPGKVCKLLLKTNSLEQVHSTVHHFAQSVLTQCKALDPKVKEGDPGYAKTLQVCKEVLKITAKGAAAERQLGWIKSLVVCGLLAILGAIYLCGIPTMGNLPGLGGVDSVVADKTVVASTMLMMMASPLYFSSSSSISSGSRPLKKCKDA